MKRLAAIRKPSGAPHRTHHRPAPSPPERAPITLWRITGGVSEGVDEVGLVGVDVQIVGAEGALKAQQFQEFLGRQADAGFQYAMKLSDTAATL